MKRIYENLSLEDKPSGSCKSTNGENDKLVLVVNDSDSDWESDTLSLTGRSQTSSNVNYVTKKMPNNANYSKYIKLDQEQPLVSNKEAFTCPVCMEVVNEQAGVLLRDCLHEFCRTCLQNVARYSEEAQIVCPYSDTSYSCKNFLQEREVRALLPKDEFEKFLQRSLTKASMNSGMFHCKTVDCDGFCEVGRATSFKCYMCSKTNCISCQAIHFGKTCEQFEMELDPADKKAQEIVNQQLNKLFNQGKAKKCPKCQTIFEKNGGCDKMRCTNCGTAFDWQSGVADEHQLSTEEGISLARDEQTFEAAMNLEGLAEDRLNHFLNFVINIRGDLRTAMVQSERILQQDYVQNLDFMRTALETPSRIVVPPYGSRRRTYRSNAPTPSTSSGSQATKRKSNLVPRLVLKKLSSATIKDMIEFPRKTVRFDDNLEYIEPLIYDDSSDDSD